ncbi:hypothetical protein [Candidatus Marinarcus aquaticus]|uniref:hypothetical protein n=1 Tax=Candidatus Marinarcus aquaticus TaxID=2044504 RepID=UPI0013E9959D|nr:hypothetical protein [Candidatus Marinarcus aquaticus]
MCLVLSLIFIAVAYTFFQESNWLLFSINLVLALFFIALLIRNIITTKKERTKT